jgi:hypothetical protein
MSDLNSGSPPAGDAPSSELGEEPGPAPTGGAPAQPADAAAIGELLGRLRLEATADQVATVAGWLAGD